MLTEWEPPPHWAPAPVIVWEPNGDVTLKPVDETCMHASAPVITNPNRSLADPVNISSTFVNGMAPVIVKAFPDSASNDTVMNHTRSMFDVRPVNTTTTTASASNAVATHIGKIRWGIQDAQGRKAATTTDALCIPSQPDFLFGTNCKHDNVCFDTVDWNMTCKVHDVRVQVDFHRSRYSFDIVINPPWPDTSPNTVAINTTPVASSTPLPSLHTRTHDAVDVFIDVPDMPLDDHSDHRNRGHTDVFCDMPGMVVTGRPRVPCHPTLVPMHTGDIRIAEIFAGSGHTSHALHNRGFAPVVYCDVDNQAAEAYADSFPRVPQFRDIRELASARPDIIDAFKSADVVVAGAPCSDHSSLNSRRDPESARSQLIFDAVDHLVAFRNKVGVFEVVPDFLHLMKGELQNVAKPCRPLIPLSPSAWTHVNTVGTRHAYAGTWW